MKMLKHKKIAIIGLGYVGLPLALAFGKRFNVVGYDVNSDRIKELSSGFDKNKDTPAEHFKLATKLSFSDNDQSIADADFYIITVPTPVKDDFSPDLSFLERASETVAKFLKKDKFVIYESTVFPGCTEDICIPILEKISGLKINIGFFCGYSPERVNPGLNGTSLDRAVKITSGSNEFALKMVDALYSEIASAGTYPVSSIVVAESAKVFENTQRDLNIALVNEFSVFLERLGVDTKEILDATDTKWNAVKFRPGLVGGHCISVDPYFLAHKARLVGYHPQVILSGRRINNDIPRYVARNVIKRVFRLGSHPEPLRFLILGFSYKEDCPDFRDTRVVDIIKELDNWGIKSDIFDPVVDPADVKKIHGFDVLKKIPNSAYDAIICAVAHSEFRSLNAKDLKEFCRSEKAIIGDVKSIFDRDQLEAVGLSVFRM